MLSMLPFIFIVPGRMLGVMSELLDMPGIMSGPRELPPELGSEQTGHHPARFRKFAGRILLGVCGATAGFMFTPPENFSAGPIKGEVSFDKPPALIGGTTLDLSLLGSIEIPTHAGPSVRVSMTDVANSDNPQEIVQDLQSLDSSEGLQTSISRAVRDLGLKGTLYSLAGVGVAMASYGLFSGERRHLRHVLKTGAAGTVATAMVMGALPVLTYDDNALDDATYHGLASFAPEYVGETSDILTAYPGNIKELGKILDYLGSLRQSALASEAIPSDAIGVLVTSDIHCLPGAYDFLAEIVKADPKIKFMLDAGDLTDHGTVAENQLCFQGIDKVGVPIVIVQGNHDSDDTVDYLHGLDNVSVIDQSFVEESGVTVYGIGDQSYTPSSESADTAHSAQALQEIPSETDILLAHRPKTVEQYFGQVGLAIAGDTHVPKADIEDGTLYVNPGTTGAAFLRAYATDKPAHRTAAIIYLDADTKKPMAVSRIDLGEIGELSLNINTCFVDTEDESPSLEC